MKKLFAIELFSAQSIAFMRSNGMLLFMVIGFFLFITPSSALVMSKFIILANGEIFALLQKYGIIKKASVPIIAITMGFLLALIIEISGFIFAVRGKHGWGLTFSIASSLASLSNYLSTFHYTSPTVVVDTFFSVFSSAAPVVIIYIIATEFEKFSHKGENPLKVYTEEASKKVNQGISENIKTFSVN